MASVSVVNRTAGTLPRVPFSRLANRILPGRYELSIAFVTAPQSRRLNRLYRGKNRPANVLSFSLSKSSGEIVIAPALARRDARAFSMSAPRFIAYLVIHALLHLKGHRHGSTMGAKERALLAALRR